MTDTPSMRKTFEDAHAADASAHQDEVQKVLGKAQSLGKDFDEIWPKVVPYSMRSPGWFASFQAWAWLHP
jgi:hypothetical protein